jgi:hypothetical protein
MSDSGPLFCDRCSTQLTPGAGNFYVVRIEAVADPAPPEIRAEELAGRDFAAEIRQVLDEAKDLSQQELLDQVYRRVTLYLCRRCFDAWIENPVT